MLDYTEKYQLWLLLPVTGYGARLREKAQRPVSIDSFLQLLAVHGRLFSAKTFGMQWPFPGARMALFVRGGQSTLPVQCYWVFQRTRVCTMRCSVVSIAWSQRAIKLHSSRCAARKMLFNTCPSNPISSRSSMASSNWYCNLMAAILTRWKKRSCCSKMRTWSAVALRAALSMEKVRSVPHWAWWDTLARVDWWKRHTITGKL